MSTRSPDAVGRCQSTKSARLGQGPSPRFEGVAKVWVAWSASPPGVVSSAKYRPRSQAKRLGQYLGVSVKVRSGLSHYRGEADLGRQKAYLSLGQELGDSPRCAWPRSLRKSQENAGGGKVGEPEGDSQKHMVQRFFPTLNGVDVCAA